MDMFKIKRENGTKEKDAIASKKNIYHLSFDIRHLSLIKTSFFNDK